MTDLVPDIETTDYGQLRVFVNNVDVTSVPSPDGSGDPVRTEISAWSSAEPFHDDQATLIFHTLSGRSVYGGVLPSDGPSWAKDWAPVEIKIEQPDGTLITLWEGNIATWDDTMGDGGSFFSVTGECTGAIYQMNTCLNPPAFDDSLTDIGEILYNKVAEQVLSYGCGLQLLDMGPAFGKLTGIVVRQTGAWDQLVSGFMASLIGLAFIPPFTNRAVVGLAYPQPMTDVNAGYWIAGSDGILVEYNNAPFWGSPYSGFEVNLQDQVNNQYEPNGQLQLPLTGIASPRTAPGYWLVAEDGGVFSFGSAQFYGSLPATSPYPFITKTVAGTTTFDSAVVAAPDILPADRGAYITDSEGFLPPTEFSSVHHGNYVGTVTPGTGFDASSVAQYQADQPAATAGSTTITVDNVIVDMAGAVDDAGYWLVDNQGHVYSFGSAVYHGNAATDVTTLNGNIVAIVRSPGTPTAPVEGMEGDGYYLLGSDGAVFCKGDAVDYGDGISSWVAPLTGIDVYPTGGYYLVNELGDVYSLPGSGTTPPPPPYHGGISSDLALAAPITGITVPPTSGDPGYVLLGGDGGTFSFGPAQNYGSIPGGGSRPNQYELGCKPGRQPYLYIKDRYTTHYTYECGQIGVAHALKRDLTMAPNVIYGEGIWPVQSQRDDNTIEYLNQWRNSIYPQMTPGDPPLYPGTPLRVGTTSAAVEQWQAQMILNGYTTIVANGTFDQNCANQAALVQIACGLTEQLPISAGGSGLGPGVVGPQTWLATFNVGSSLASTLPAFFAPLAADPTVLPWQTNADGSIPTPAVRNKYQDFRFRRVERYENFGNYMPKTQGIAFAQTELVQQKAATWTGTLTIKVDAPERHRFEMRAGMNILYKNFTAAGGDILLHCSRVAVDPSSMTVTATVDSAFRDALYVDQIMDRNKSLTDPDKRTLQTTRQSYVTWDTTAAVDVENGGGRIPPHQIAAKTWNVYRIPLGKQGTIVHSEFRCTEVGDANAGLAFSVGIFSAPITPIQLAQMGAPLFQGFPGPFYNGGVPDPTTPMSPLITNTAGDNPWDDVNDATGLFVAWGGPDQAAGYYPDDQSDSGSVPTGDMIDDSSLTYYASSPPWVYIAEWCDTDAIISGQLFPSAPSF